MANYRIPKEISSELKINKWLYFQDLGVLIGTLLITFLFKGFVYEPLLIPFYVFMAVVAILLIIRPSSNPKKRMYQVILLSLLKKEDVYEPLDYTQDEEEEE